MVQSRWRRHTLQTLVDEFPKRKRTSFFGQSERWRNALTGDRTDQFVRAWVRCWWGGNSPSPASNPKQSLRGAAMPCSTYSSVRRRSCMTNKKKPWPIAGSPIRNNALREAVCRASNIVVRNIFLKRATLSKNHSMMISRVVVSWPPEFGGACVPAVMWTQAIAENLSPTAWSTCFMVRRVGLPLGDNAR